MAKTRIFDFLAAKFLPRVYQVINSSIE